MTEMMTCDQAGRDDAIDPSAILVAIPTLNEAAHIERTLGMLCEGVEALRRVRFVVADGGSTDGTRAIVSRYAREHPNVRLIDNPAKVQSAAVNQAVELCAGTETRVLVRCDAHATYPTAYVLKVARSLVGRDAAALSTVMDSIGTTCFQRGTAWAIDTVIGSGGSRHRAGLRSGYVDHGHHAGFRLDTWRRVGGYAADFATNEDAELDHRIRKVGERIWLDAEIRIGYVVRSTLAGLARQYWRYGRGRARTTIRHRLRPRLRQVIPVLVLVANAIALLAAPLAYALLAVPLAYAALVSAVGFVLALRHRSLCGLWAAPALCAIHHAWGAGFLWQAAAKQDRS